MNRIKNIILCGGICICLCALKAFANGQYEAQASASAVQSLVLRDSSTVLCFEASPTKAQRARIDSIAEYMKAHPKCRVRVVGNWDGKCTATEAEKKANKLSSVVVNILTGKGIARRRILDSNSGARNPIGDNDTPKGRKANRRVELIILEK